MGNGASGGAAHPGGTGLAALPAGVLRGSGSEVEMQLARQALLFAGETEGVKKLIAEHSETIEKLEEGGKTAAKGGICYVTKTLIHKMFGEDWSPINPVGLIWAHVDCGIKAFHGDGKGAVKSATKMIGAIPGAALGFALAGPIGGFLGGMITGWLYSYTAGSIIDAFDVTSVKYTIRITNQTGMYLRLQDLEKWSKTHGDVLGTTDTKMALWGGPENADGKPSIMVDTNIANSVTARSNQGGRLVVPPATSGADPEGNVKAGCWNVVLQQQSTHFCNIFRFEGFSSLSDMAAEKVAHTYTVAIIGRSGIWDPVSKVVKTIRGADFQNHYASVWQADGDGSISVCDAWTNMHKQTEVGQSHGCTLDTGSTAYWDKWEYCVVELK